MFKALKSMIDLESLFDSFKYIILGTNIFIYLNLFVIEHKANFYFLNVVKQIKIEHKANFNLIKIEHKANFNLIKIE
jgi:hypothetical protein